MISEVKVVMKMVLPYPEEPPDPTKTVANTDIEAVIDKWLLTVPPAHRDFWKHKISVHLYDIWTDVILSWGIQPETPAFVIEQNGVRHLYSLAKWFNVGTVKHEQAHNAYSLLTPLQQQDFSATLHALLPYNRMLQYLFEVKEYAIHGDDVEAHAEIYRYLKVPDEFKIYYPRLF